MRALFFGGPLAGQTHDMETCTRFWEVPLFPPPISLDRLAEPSEPFLRTFMYERQPDPSGKIDWHYHPAERERPKKMSIADYDPDTGVLRDRTPFENPADPYQPSMAESYRTYLDTRLW